MGPPLDLDVHQRRSPPLTPQPFQASRARRPRHGGDWTYRHSGLSRFSQGLPVSSPDSLRPFRTGSAPWILDLLGAHLMGFTFVTDCLPCLRLLPTPPHGNAVTGHSPLNDVIGGDVVFIRGLWFSGARPKRVLFEAPSCSLLVELTAVSKPCWSSLFVLRGSGFCALQPPTKNYPPRPGRAKGHATDCVARNNRSPDDLLRLVAPRRLKATLERPLPVQRCEFITS